jgi:hypothetical protein
MIGSPSRRQRRALWAVTYAVTCLVMVAVGWTAVVVIVPGVQAGAPSGSALAYGSTAAATPSGMASSTAAIESATPSGTMVPRDTPVATPTKAPFEIDLYTPGSFVSQINRDYCVAGALQNMLNIIGPNIDLTTARQKQIGSLLVSLTTRQDSYNGGFGPAGWALTLTKLGAGPYKLIIDPTFDQAMHDAAYALSQTSRPVGLLTWWGLTRGS